MNRVVESVAANQAFTATVAPYLLLDGDLTIRAVNDAYLTATGFDHAEQLIGQNMFDAFPDNPAERGATGVRNLAASLQGVLSRGTAHAMAIQRYDVAPAGRFVHKLWTPVNSPISDDRDRPVGVLHHVEDLTDVITAPDPSAAAQHHPADRAVALHQRAQRQMSIENTRLRDALVAIAISRPAAFSHHQPAVVEQRRSDLWQHVVECAGEHRSWQGWADALCRVAAAALSSVTGVAISLHDTGRQELVAASDAWACRAEQIDYLVGEGPLRRAAADGLPIDLPDLSRDAVRWPGYVLAAADNAIAGLSTFPVTMGTHPVATISFYRSGPGRPSPPEWVDTALFADMATSALAADHERIEIQLAVGGAIGYHDVAVATGMLAAQLGVPFDTALSLIRARALAHYCSVNDIAVMIINRTIDFEID